MTATLMASAFLVHANVPRGSLDMIALLFCALTTAPVSGAATPMVLACVCQLALVATALFLNVPMIATATGSAAKT